MKQTLISLLIILLCSRHAFAGAMDDGRRAYERLDYKTALSLLHPLAEQGNVTAEFIVGKIYISGLYGVSENHSEGITWLKLAARGGNPYAARMVAADFEFGANANLAEARKWNALAEHGLQTLSEKGDVEAQMGLANLYAEIEQNYSQAYFWYKIAALDRRASLYGLRNPLEAAADAAKQLTPRQRAQVDTEISIWLKSHSAGKKGVDDRSDETLPN